MCCNIRSFLTGILVFRDVKRQLCALFQKWDYVLHTNVPLNHLHDHPCHCRHFAVRERHKQFRTFVAFRTFALQTATLHDPKDPAIEYSSIPMSGKYVHKARLSKLVSIFGPSTENTLKWYRRKSLIPSNASDVIIHQEQKDLAYLKLPHRKPKDGAVQCTMHDRRVRVCEGGQLFDEILVFKSSMVCDVWWIVNLLKSRYSDNNLPKLATFRTLLKLSSPTHCRSLFICGGGGTAASNMNIMTCTAGSWLPFADPSVEEVIPALTITTQSPQWPLPSWGIMV